MSVTSIVIIARWHPILGKRQKFIQLVENLKEAMPQEAAQHFETLLPSMSMDGTFVFIEKWSSEAVMNQFRASEAFHLAMANMSACCDRPLKIEHLSTVNNFNLSELEPMASYPAGKANSEYYPDLNGMTPVYV